MKAKRSVPVSFVQHIRDCYARQCTVNAGKRFFHVVGIALLLTRSGAAQKFTKADVDALRTTDSIPNLHLRQALGARARLDAGDAVSESVSAVDTNSLNQAFQSIKVSYDNAKQNSEIERYILKANDFGIKQAVVGGLAAAAAGPIIAPIAGVAATMTFWYVEKAFDESAQNDLRRLLRTRLDGVEQQSEVQYTHLLTITDPQQFLQELTTASGALFGTALDQLPQNVQDQVNEFTIKETSKIMQNGFGWVAQTVALQEDELDQNKTNITGLAQTFYQFTDTMSGQIVEIKQQQSDLKTSLDQLQTSVSADDQKLDSVTEFLYAKLSPDERLAAINAGLLDGTLPQENIDLLKSEAEMEKKSQQLQSNVKEYLDGASSILQIAKNLGVSSDILKPAQDVVNAGQAIFSAVSAFSSGNYLGALASVTSIFGMGGPDTNAVRFQEILDRLGKIDGKLDILGNKLDLVLKGEQEIIDLQKQTYQAIVSISQQIAESHKQEMQSLTTIEYRLTSLNNTLLNLATRDFSACTNLVTPSNINDPILDTSTKLYPSEASISDLFLNHKQWFGDCFSHFVHTIQFDPQSGHAVFDPTFFPLTVYRTQPDIPQQQQASLDQIDTFVEQVYSNALAILNGVPLDGFPIEQRISSLFIPVESSVALHGKLNSTLQVSNGRGFSPAQLFDLVRVPLSVPEVLSHARAAANIHFYYLFLDAFDNPRSWRDLINAGDIRTTGKDDLNDAQILVDVAIAQQVLLSGDALIPLISEVLDNWGSSLSQADSLHCYVQKESDLPQTCRDTFTESQLRLILAGVTETTRQTMVGHVVDLLAADDVLAKNYVLVRLRADVLSNGSTLAYAVALAQSDDFMLQSVSGARYPFKYATDTGTWNVVIGNATIPVPTATALSDGVLLFPSFLQDLLTVRSRISDELSTYSPIDVGSVNDLANVNSVLLAAAPGGFSQ